jgi:hypothetical protein
MTSSLERAFATLAIGLTDLDRALHQAHGPARLLGALGFTLPPGATDIGLDALDLSAVVNGLSALGSARISGTSVQVGGAYTALATEVPAAITRLRALGATLAASPDYLARTQLPTELFPRLLDLVVLRTVAGAFPPAFAAGSLIGIFVLQRFEADPANFIPAHLRHIVRWDRLEVVLTDPVRLLREQVGWGTPTFSADGLALAAGGLLQLIGVAPRMRALPRRAEERLAGVAIPDANLDPRVQLFVSLVKGLAGDELDLGLSIYGLRSSGAGGSDGGVGFSPYLYGSTQDHFALADGLTLDIEGLPDVLNGLSLQVRPGRVAAVTGINGPGALTPVTRRVALRLTRTPAPTGGAAAEAQPSVLLSIPGGTRIEYGTLAIIVGFRPGRGPAPEPFVELALTGARFVIDASEASPVLKALLPKDLLSADVDLGLGWSAGRAYLTGSADLQASFEVDRSLGPIELQAIHLGLAPGGGGIPVQVTATLATSLGPLNVVIDGIGLRAALGFPAGGGNLGPAQLDLDFGPPTGLGVSLDAGPVQGGGYLSVDAAGNRFAGVLHFELSFIGITAYGIYEQTSGGAASFVAVLGIRFWPGIQLGFGFALTGVGGLVGLNRQANVDLLRERLVTGASGNVLFCDDPVKNAPTLLGDLAAFFPSADGWFVVGPTFQLGWMTPLVRLDVAVLIELPGPSKIILLGSIRVLIGLDETLALLYLRMDFLGVLDFEHKTVSLDASLVNSHALGVFRLSGGMAFRLSYGDNPYILLTVGGFHPRFDPGPLNLPTIPRVGAVLEVGVVASMYLRLELYVAFTSNTLQLGAKVEAGMELGPISAHGYLSFDALIQFRPFAFDIEFSAGFSVQVFDVSLCSVDVSGQITGPGPLVVHAHASVKILLIRVSASATVELGGHDGDKVQTVPSIVKALERELTREANLRAEGGDSDVALAPAAAPVAGVLVSPRGTLVWEQKLAPLQTLVDRFEGAPLAGSHRLRLDAPAGWTVSDESDWFSPGSFTSLDLKSSQTMNNATFQWLRSGFRIGSAGDATAPTPVVYMPAIDLIKRPARTRFANVLVGSYLNAALTEALRERDTTPPVRPGLKKVTVTPETFDVTGSDGRTLVAGETPFEAFQLARQEAGSVATPSADVVVAL